MLATVFFVLFVIFSADAFFATTTINPRKNMSTRRLLSSSTTESTNAPSNTDLEEEQRQQLKQELMDLSESSNRGFQGSRSDRQQAKDIILKLAKCNPTKEPALAYYDENNVDDDSMTEPTLTGKWTLVYTDAPDITGLDTSNNPLPSAKLGRIGQECSPPFIKNVIEWQRPDWAGSLPFSGGTETRILQKVVTKGKSNPSQPRTVNLDIAGLELESGGSVDVSSSNNVLDSIQENGLVAGWLDAIGGIDLKGPLNPPFGQFELLYLDDDFRMIRTGQGFFACNQRIQPGEEWF